MNCDGRTPKARERTYSAPGVRRQCPFPPLPVSEGKASLLLEFECLLRSENEAAFEKTVIETALARSAIGSGPESSMPSILDRVSLYGCTEKAPGLVSELAIAGEGEEYWSIKSEDLL